jgi:hypothetical protein
MPRNVTGSDLPSRSNPISNRSRMYAATIFGKNVGIDESIGFLSERDPVKGRAAMVRILDAEVAVTLMNRFDAETESPCSLAIVTRLLIEGGLAFRILPASRVEDGQKSVLFECLTFNDGSRALRVMTDSESYSPWTAIHKARQKSATKLITEKQLESPYKCNVA